MAVFLEFLTSVQLQSYIFKPLNLIYNPGPAGVLHSSSNPKIKYFCYVYFTTKITLIGTEVSHIQTVIGFFIAVNSYDIPLPDVRLPS